MLFPDLLDQASHYGHVALTSRVEQFTLLSVVVASALVIVSSFVKTMIPLRWLAVGSNIGFVVWGVMHASYPMLALHSILLPINLYRLFEMIRLTRRVRAATSGEGLSGVWLKPYMRSAKVAAGTVLFNKGDSADRLYLLAAGRIDLVEINGHVAPGEIFGEIAFFAPDHRRRLTARCAEDCTVMSIDESTVKQLYYQNPAFGFRLIELVAGRLSADVERLTRRQDGDSGGYVAAAAASAPSID